MQETDFPFEIIIHDDASTDRTQEIIRHYSNAYPKLFKIIFQKVNQYSQGINPGAEFLVPAANGKYVALCEGDDYWTEKRKIALQVMMLEQSKADLVFNPSITLEADEKQNWIKKKRYGYYGESLRRINLTEIFSRGGGAMPAASIMIRNESLLVLENNCPGFMRNNLSHFYIQVLGAIRVPAVYIPQYMSVYRRGHIGSWTRSNKNPESQVKNITVFIRKLDVFNGATNFKYSNLVRDLRRRKIIEALRLENTTSVGKENIFALTKATLGDKLVVLLRLKIISLVVSSKCLSAVYAKLKASNKT